MQKLFYISNTLPNNILGGSDLLAFNILQKLKKKFRISVISISKDYCKKKELHFIRNNLKKNKIKFYEIRKKVKYSGQPILIWNFFNKEYINNTNIHVAKNFIDTCNIKRNDIIFSYGSASILASSHLKCLKIALLEDIQDQINIYRTRFSINKFNFIKKILKLIMIKVHFRGYYKWLKKITNSHQIIYTFSPFDYSKINNYLNLSILPIPFQEKIKKKKIKKKKLFNISMISAWMSQDFNGIIQIYNSLIPKLEKYNLMKKVKINLIMRKPKFIPENIKNILKDRRVNLIRYNDNIVQSTDMLYYPSKYPVGLRSKILFAISKSWFVATTKTVNKCIPELKDYKNCIMSNQMEQLNDKIMRILSNPQKFKYLIKNSYKILKKYSVKSCVKKIERDLTRLTN